MSYAGENEGRYGKERLTRVILASEREGLVNKSIQIALAMLLFGIAGLCVVLAIADREAPHDVWWAYWTIDAFVGVGSVLAGLWLLLPKKPKT